VRSSVAPCAENMLTVPRAGLRSVSPLTDSVREVREAAAVPSLSVMPATVNSVSDYTSGISMKYGEAVTSSFSMAKG